MHPVPDETTATRPRRWLWWRLLALVLTIAALVLDTTGLALTDRAAAPCFENRDNFQSLTGWLTIDFITFFAWAMLALAQLVALRLPPARRYEIMCGVLGAALLIYLWPSYALWSDNVRNVVDCATESLDEIGTLQIGIQVFFVWPFTVAFTLIAGRLAWKARKAARKPDGAPG